MTKRYKLLFTTITILAVVGLGMLSFLANIPFGPGAQDFAKSLEGGYKLYRMSENNVIIAPEVGWNKDAAFIPEKVIRLNESNEFVIAERQGLKRRSPNDSTDAYQILDPTVIDYWILDTHKKLVFKTLTKQQLITKLDSLKLPKDLKLIDIYKY
jgi:hypothetical protein